MTCPVCGGNTHITRSVSDVDVVLRKRVCYECGYGFYTSEYEDDKAEKEYKEIMRVKMKERYARRNGE